MKNLENYGVLEMDTMEINKIYGGKSAAWHVGWILGRISKYNGNSTHIWGY